MFIGTKVCKELLTRSIKKFEIYLIDSTEKYKTVKSESKNALDMITNKTT